MTPEQTALLQKAQESPRAARLLAEQAFFGFAVSRAYYFMFYVAQALLLKDGLTFSKHSALIAAFGQHFVKSGLAPQEFHRYLIEGQSSRNLSDYDTGAAFSRDQTAVHIERAERFLELAQQLLGSLPDPLDQK